jgi:hypothetical protein
MRGFPFIPGSMGLELLMFPTKWFTRAIRSRFSKPDAIGQIEMESRIGHVLWAADLSGNEKPLLPALFDHLAVEAGLRGIQTLIASTHRDNYTFEILLKAGYSPISFKNIWKYQPKSIIGNTQGFSWRRTRSSDLFPVSLVQNRLLNRQEKIFVASVNDSPPDFVLTKDDNVYGYAHVIANQKQLLITPVIDHGKESAFFVIEILIRDFFGQRQTTYLAQLSSQHWIEFIPEDQITPAVPRQEIMAKFLAVQDQQRAVEHAHVRRNQHTDIITPSIKPE